MDYGMDYSGGGGAGGGFNDGGGFTGSSQYGGGTQSGGGGGGRKTLEEQTVIPVTVRMAVAAEPEVTAEGSGSIKLEDGRCLNNVRIIGAVRSCEDHSTNVLYSIEDGTGLIDVKQWLDDGDCAALAELRQQTLQDNIYVRVVGQVKDYDGKKMIVASSVRPLSTANELTHHFLEVVYSAERSKRKSTIVAPASSPMMMGSGGGVGFGSSPMGGGAPVSQISGGSGNVLRDAIINYVKKEGDSSEVGIHVQNCVSMLSGQYGESDIRSQIQDLVAEGHIYTTVDDFHYKFAM